MHKITLDGLITALFVIILGALWFFTRRYEGSHQYRIIVHDRFGKQTRLDGIRTVFNTHAVAASFVKYYNELFPGYGFTLEADLLHLRRRVFAIKKTQR
jgi:hypothetical protein